MTDHQDQEEIIDKDNRTMSVSDPLIDIVGKIPKLIDQNDVDQMVASQERSLSRMEEVNKLLTSCSAMADEKIQLVSRLYKKASKNLVDSKKDLDYIFKKISELKSEIKAEKPELSNQQPQNSSQDE